MWLLGERPLDSRVDAFTESCTTEADVAHKLWEDTQLPEEWRNLPVTFIVVPMKSEGKVRPSTEDTVRAWFSAHPRPCKALFISDQPFCGYQFAVIKTTLPEEFLFDLVGPETELYSHPSGAAITLDSVARWLYQESLNNND